METSWLWWLFCTAVLDVYLLTGVVLIMQIVAKSLEGLSIESAFDLQKILRIDTHTSHASASQKLHKALPYFQSRMGALLFLISALLSRGLVCLQSYLCICMPFNIFPFESLTLSLSFYAWKWGYRQSISKPFPFVEEGRSGVGLSSLKILISNPF